MDRAMDTLRSGAWLTRARMRRVAFAMLAACTIGLGYLIATSDGLIDLQGRPLGTDFSNVYAAGTYVLEGNPKAPFDPARQHGRERVLFGEETPFYGWHYPPFFLFIAGALALLPYGLALAVWQGVTLGLYLWAMQAIISTSWPWPGLSRPSTSSFQAMPQDVDARHKVYTQAGPSGPRNARPDGRLRPDPCAGHDEVQRGFARDHLWLLLALAFPAVFINIGHGHNGFLSAALLGLALITLERRPWHAGILFGLIAYKPQFGLLIPLVLGATGRWRAFAAAAATVAALVVATILVFGLDVWSAFLTSARFTREVVLEEGGTGWHKIQSAFAWVRMWGGGVPLAYAAQGMATVAVGVALVWLWRSEAAFALKAAALSIGVLLVTPYSLDYDMMLLAPAIAFLSADGLARGFGPWEKTALAALWVVPLVARSVAEWTLVPLGVATMLVVFALVMRRAASHRSIVKDGFPRLSG